MTSRPKSHLIANSRTKVRKHAAPVDGVAQWQRDGDFAPKGKEAVSKPSPSQKGYFEAITEIDQLLRMWLKVRNARSILPRYVRFNENRLKNLQIIQYRLRTDTFEFGPYQYFIVKEKTRRSVANAPLKDRPPHWLLYEHLMNQWQRRFIHDCYGNLPGKGTHAAVRRLASWARKPSLTHALQIDIAKYFSSIQHAYLKKVLFEREGNSHIRILLDGVIDSFITSDEFDHLFEENSTYRLTKAKGIALGNLVSQIIANIYLNEFDHWIKETLRVKYYLRYVDDIIILGSSAEELTVLRRTIEMKLLEIGLDVNPKKTKIRKISCGIPSLGYIVWPNHISAGKRVRRQYAKKLRRSGGKDNAGLRAAYNGIFKHTGATR